MNNDKTDLTLIECLREISDPRAPYNQKHNFIDIVVIAVTAILCGMDTWNEIEDWGKARKEWLETFLELPGGIPSHDTINRVFQYIDPKQFHEAFFRWTEAISGKIEGVVAIDGKTICGSRGNTENHRAAHVVSAWAVENSLVLGQLKVDEKTNEIKAIPELLETLYLKGCIVTIDAMGTQKDIAEKIVERGGDYILQVKGNQPALQEDIALYFEKELFVKAKTELEEQKQYYCEYCNEHGRLEKREYYVENEIEWLKQNHKGWKNLKGIGACVSTVTENGKTARSKTYAIYSIEGLHARNYGQKKRSHWGIENSLHWVLDIGFREDESRMRAGNAAENVNVMRHIGDNLLKQEKSCKMGIASKRKKCGYDMDYLYKVLGLSGQNKR